MCIHGCVCAVGVVGMYGGVGVRGRCVKHEAVGGTNND